MFGAGRPGFGGRYRPGFRYGRGFGFPFLAGALIGASVARPNYPYYPYNPYYPPYPYYPYYPYRYY